MNSHPSKCALDRQRTWVSTRLAASECSSTNVHARKDRLGSALEKIGVGDDVVKLIGNKQVLTAAGTGQNTTPANVRGLA